jgi:hypothetical protein
MGNYVIAVGNYVSATPSELGNFVSVDTTGFIAALPARIPIHQRRLPRPAWAGLAVLAQPCPDQHGKRQPGHLAVQARPGPLRSLAHRAVSRQRQAVAAPDGFGRRGPTLPEQRSWRFPRRR